MTDERQESASDEETTRSPLAHNVTHLDIIDSVGAIMLGILATILLIALLRAQAHNRALMSQLAQQDRD